MTDPHPKPTPRFYAIAPSFTVAELEAAAAEAKDLFEAKRREINRRLAEQRTRREPPMPGFF